MKKAVVDVAHTCPCSLSYDEQDTDDNLEQPIERAAWGRNQALKGHGRFPTLLEEFLILITEECR